MSDNAPTEAPSVVIDDAELARRSNDGFGEILAILGQGVGKEAVVRWPNAVGCKFEPGFCPDFFNSVVVPFGAPPPVDDPGSHYVLTSDVACPGRVLETDMVFPLMGITLDDPALNLEGAAIEVEEPSREVLALVNERAYGDAGFAPLACGINDPRVRLYGVRVDGKFACVAMTLSIGDDLSVHFVATEAEYRRRGLASSLVKALLVEGRKQGMKTSTLQASPDGLPVWKRIGYREVGVVRGFVRPKGVE